MPIARAPRPSPDRVPPNGGSARKLSTLLRQPRTLDSPTRPEDVRITGITSHSQDVCDGSLFVAIRGTKVDGHDFIGDAALRGAAAVIVEESPLTDPGVPVFRTENSRRLLAELAAEWHGRPAETLSMVGVTGTLGKTSTLTMLEAILTADCRRVGSLGSLGLKIHGTTLEATGYTAPEPLVLQKELARVADDGCEIALMEVTSHGLDQERVAGIEFDLGILTNLIPLEHQDYHGSFRAYVDAKRRFFDHLGPCAPLVYDVDNLAARRLVHDYEIEPIGCGTARSAMVRIEPRAVTASGTSFVLNVRRTIPLVSGGNLDPLRLPLEIRLLGRSNVSNATLAASAALSFGVDPDVIQDSLAGIPPPRRRMEIIHQEGFTILDDTVGHPESISAVFQVAEAFSPRRIHIAFAVRGRRGRKINNQSGRTVAIMAARFRPDTLVVTRSEEAADERNRVEDGEAESFQEPLLDAGIPFLERKRLDEAIRTVLDRARDGDLVLLLGAQGMDDAQAITREWLAERHGAALTPP